MKFNNSVKILIYGGYWDFELLNNMRKNFNDIKVIASEYNVIIKKVCKIIRGLTTFCLLKS